MRTSSSALSVSRRQFLASAALSSIAWSQSEAAPAFTFCAFTKFVQSLSPKDLADTLADMGYDGIEGTIRKGGQVEPERVEQDLPVLVEALKAANLDLTIMASDVDRADDPVMVKTLRTAAALGVKRYRMAYYKYDFSKPIRPQLENFRPLVRELAALNKELGLQAIYQNHAGAHYVGASLWDLDMLLEGIDPKQIAVGFDVRHATVEGGTTWETGWHLIQPRLGAVYLKDFVWDGLKMQNVPLGEGRVASRLFDLVQKRADVPFSVHVEYLEKGTLDENVAALKRDLAAAKTALGAIAAR